MMLHSIVFQSLYTPGDQPARSRKGILKAYYHAIYILDCLTSSVLPSIGRNKNGTICIYFAVIRIDSVYERYNLKRYVAFENMIVLFQSCK